MILNADVPTLEGVPVCLWYQFPATQVIRFKKWSIFDETKLSAVLLQTLNASCALLLIHQNF